VANKEAANAPSPGTNATPGAQDFAGAAAGDADVAARNMAVIHQEIEDAESARALAGSAAAGYSTENKIKMEKASLPVHGVDSPSQKRKRDDDMGAVEDLGDTSDERSGIGGGSSADKRTRQERRRERIQKLQAYYSGTKTGTPAAYVAYELANQLGRSGNDLLWYAIVGVTSHHAQGRMDNDIYSGLHMALRDWVNANNSSAGGEAAANVATTLAVGDDDTATRIRVPDEGRISVKNQEFRIMLYRHWNVYEAMYHSLYVSTQLSTWVEKGRHRLDTFLAKMGISKKECQQPFSYMSAVSKNKLRNKVGMFKSEHGLEDLLYRSFTRTQGYAQETSAADTAHAVLAMIECGSAGLGAGSHKVHVPKHVAEGTASASSTLLRELQRKRLTPLFQLSSWARIFIARARFYRRPPDPSGPFVSA
jgi:hypothetical protein